MCFKQSLLLPLAVLSLGVLPACSDDGEDNPPRTEAGTDAGIDAGVGEDLDACSDAGIDAGMDGDSDAGSDAGPDEGSDAGSDAGSDEGSDAGSDAGPDEGSDAGSDAGIDAGDGYPGPSNEPSACPDNVLLCELFDEVTTPPPSWTAHAEYATLQVDSTRTRNGAGALHIITEDGIDEREQPVSTIAYVQRQTDAFDTQFFVRAHVYMRSLPRVLGQTGTVFMLANFDSDFGGIELQVRQDSGFALDDWSGREGQGWSHQPAPIQVGMEAGRWVCLEWEVRRDSAASTHGHTRVYVDGALAHDFANVGMRAFNSFSVGYGFFHPLGPSGSEMWIDNVVVSTQRVGCN